MIDKIIKLTPLAGALLIFLGVLKLIFYYSYFDIQIINYLEFQEIITSFLGDINIIIIFGITMTLITLFALNMLSRSTKTHVDDILEKILHFISLHKLKYFLLFLVIILIISTLLYLKEIKYNYFLIYLLTYCTAQMLTFLFLSKEKDGEIDISNFYVILIVGISLSMSIFLFAQKEIQESVYNKNEVIIKTTNDTIQCNNKSRNVFIGKTSKYVFIKIKNATVVIPSEEILRYEFK